MSKKKPPIDLDDCLTKAIKDKTITKVGKADAR